MKRFSAEWETQSFIQIAWPHIETDWLPYLEDAWACYRNLTCEIAKREKVDLCVTIGPAIMMKFVSLLTKKYEIPTVASLNTIMVDGTGMCGACRITVDGKTKFVCVDGPEFDAHQVDFDEMLMRLGAYREQEQEAKAKLAK